jgi:hypothetical protein
MATFGGWVPADPVVVAVEHAVRNTAPIRIATAPAPTRRTCLFMMHLSLLLLR